MEKKTKILMGIVAVFVILLIFSITIRINRTEQRIENLTQSLTEAGTRIWNLEVVASSLEYELMQTRYMIADAWVSMQPFEVRKKINESLHGLDCLMIEKDVRVLKNWYDLPKEAFRLMVIDFELGHMVFDNDGTVKCYPDVIQDMNPEDIPCDELCQD